MMTLQEYILTHPFIGPFKPSVFYNKYGNMLEVYWDEEPCFTTSGGEGFDLMIGQESGKVVGIQIFGVKQLIAEEKKE